MSFSFGQRSEKSLVGVHPDLVKVVRLALTLSEVDFTVIEGVRTVVRQAALVSEGKSKTMKGKHLIQPSGFGHAVDLYPAGIPTDWKLTPLIAKAMFKAAEILEVKIRWGGDWNQNGKSDDEKFFDSPHFELDSKFYS